MTITHELELSINQLAATIRNLSADETEKLSKALENDRDADENKLVTTSGPIGDGVVPIDEERADSSEELTFAESSKYHNGVEAGIVAKVQRKSFNHRGQDWNPLTARSGTDTFAITVPAGYEYSHYELTPLNTTFPHELEVTSAPQRGATGDTSIKARWKLWGLGQINYQLSAFSHRQGSSPRVQVIIGSRQWEVRAAQLIAQKQPFSLVLSGAEAERLWNGALKLFSGNTEVEPVVTITLAIVGGVVALAGFATIAYVLTQAINQGCNAKASYKPTGTFGDLVFDVNGCRK